MWKWLIVLCVSFSAILSAETKILAFSGSTRKDSANKKLVAEAAKIARDMKADVTVIDLKDYMLPLYDGDIESSEGMPAKAKELRQLMMNSDVIMISSPKYNGSISGVLKNTIDWVSRGENGGECLKAFKRKFFIMSASPGKGGGVGGLVHLRAILGSVRGKVISQQVCLPDAYKAFDEQGNLKNEKVKQELQQALKTIIN